MNDSELLELHAEHRRLLAALLCQPDIEAFQQDDVCGRLRHSATVLSPALQAPDLELPAGNELPIAFTKIFLGPGRIPASPYGSVYLDGEGLVAGASTTEVGRFYREEGLTVADDAAELPDHAAIELEFSAHLIDRAASATDSAERRRLLARQEEFEARYMRPWFPAFGSRITASSIHGFYASIGELLTRIPPVPAMTDAGG